MDREDTVKLPPIVPTATSEDKRALAKGSIMVLKVVVETTEVIIECKVHCLHLLYTDTRLEATENPCRVVGTPDRESFGVKNKLAPIRGSIQACGTIGLANGRSNRASFRKHNVRGVVVSVLRFPCTIMMYATRARALAGAPGPRLRPPTPLDQALNHRVGASA